MQLELTEECSRDAQYKVNMQKSVAFLYTSNNQMRSVIQKRPHSQLQQKLYGTYEQMNEYIHKERN